MTETLNLLCRGVDRETSKDSLLALARKARLRARRELGEGENILKLSSFIKITALLSL